LKYGYFTNFIRLRIDLTLKIFLPEIKSVEIFWQRKAMAWRTYNRGSWWTALERFPSIHWQGISVKEGILDNVELVGVRKYTNFEYKEEYCLYDTISKSWFSGMFLRPLWYHAYDWRKKCRALQKLNDFYRSFQCHRSIWLCGDWILSIQDSWCQQHHSYSTYRHIQRIQKQLNWIFS